MTQQFDDASQEPRDYAKFMWGAVAVLIAAMVLFMLTRGQGSPRRSEVTTKHILINYDASDPADKARALALIKEIRDKIANGEASFAEMASRYSDDPLSAQRGGHLGAHGKGEMSEQYENYSWNGPIGELSEIIQTGYGFHIMIVEDRYISPADAYEEDLERRIRTNEGGDAAAESGS